MSACQIASPSPRPPIGERLSAEAQHEIIEPGGADLGEDFFRQRPRQVDAAYFGAECFPQLPDLDRGAHPMCFLRNSSVRVRASFALSAWYEPRWSQLKPCPAG